MVRVSEINLNEKDIFFPYHHWYTVFLDNIIFIYDEKVFFKSSSCLKYIQKNLIEITKKMYTVSHWHADLVYYLHYFYSKKKSFPFPWNLSASNFFIRRGIPVRESKKPQQFLVFLRESDENTIKLFKRLFELSIFSTLIDTLLVSCGIWNLFWHF